jgi:hypothetical protein
MLRPWMIERRRQRPTRAIGADFFVVGDAVIAYNSRRGHWTIRRAGKIVGEATTAQEAEQIARATRETAHNRRD